jgi:glycerol-3-phosphate acyltransferase PlsX
VIIAVDAMGGDYAPDEIVKGAILAANEYGVDILLVGQEEAISPLLPPMGTDGHIQIMPANDVISMNAHPLAAVRKQPNASIVVAAREVKTGRAQALVSFGSTGATMAASLLNWGRIKGVERPAIAIVLPTLQGLCLLLDAGAQADARPNHLMQFATMGVLYTKRVLGVDNPRVGLLNIGEEDTKGNELTLAVYNRLKSRNDITFIGNVEGRDVLPGKADVLICDGFMGNVVLKTIEGVAHTIFTLIGDAVTSTTKAKLGAMLLRDSLKIVKKQLDYTEYGGAPLLGVQGVCIIGHGSSNAKAVKNAIRVAKEAVETQVVAAIADRVSAESD